MEWVGGQQMLSLNRMLQTRHLFGKNSFAVNLSY